MARGGASSPLPASYCLREKLWQEIDLFDAIEFSHFYTPRIDFNRPAVKLAAAVGLPLLGTSDSHLDEQFGTTFSLIEADLSGGVGAGRGEGTAGSAS